MTRVIHTGDTHIGYRQYHSPARREDFLEAFRRVVEDAIEADVDAVVHAGDLFHDRRPGLQNLLGTISALRPLREADIPFLAIVGNHEGTRDAQWLDLFETLDLATRLDAEGITVGDVALYGLDYVPESKRDALDYDFAAREASHRALVSHGLFTPFAHANWDLEAVLEASPVDFDAVLLGDNHVPDTVQVGDTWVTYCGSTERTSASERDPRGYNIVEFDAEADEVRISRRGLDTRDFVFVDLDLHAGEGEARVRERIREEDVADAVLVVTVEGDGEQVTPADIEAFGDEQGALVTRVNDRREFDETVDVEVSFADPDEAVRERVRELGLSEAARDLDETVRESTVADSNVRDAVVERVRERVDADDLDAFEPADGAEEPSDGEPVDEESSDGETAADTATDDTAADTATDETAAADGDTPTDETAAADDTPADETAAADDTLADETAADDDGDTPTDETAADDDTPTDDAQPADEPDGDAANATMEDFL